MRETFKFKSKKLRIEDLDIAYALIKEKYPHALIEGSLNHYLAFSNDTVVAEAWLSRTGKNWWLKIRD